MLAFVKFFHSENGGAMTPVAKHQTSELDQRYFRKVEHLVHDLPDLDYGRINGGKEIVLSCHILSLALGELLGLRVVHGHYVHFYQHSWLLGPSGNVIDPYPVSTMGGPILVANDQTPLLPGKRLYFPSDEKEFQILYAKMFASGWFKGAVDLTVCELKKLI